MRTSHLLSSPLGRVRRAAGVVTLVVLSVAAGACASDAETSTTGAPGTAGPDDTAAPGTAGPDDTAGPDGSEPVSADALTVYSGRSEELVGPILEQFTEETGIEVAFRGGDSGEMAAQLLTEGDASPADVFFSQDAGALGAVEDAGLLAALPEELLSSCRPSSVRRTVSGSAMSGRVRVLVVNPELVPDPPTTIDELLDPQWKGKLGFAPTNASWQSFVTALRLTRGEDGARTWLEAFAEQDPVAYERNGAVRDAVDAGDVSIGLVNHYYVYEKIAAEGEDERRRPQPVPRSGGPRWADQRRRRGHPVVERRAGRCDASLVEFLLGENAQTYFAETTYEYPLRSGVPVAEGLPALDTLDAARDRPRGPVLDRGDAGAARRRRPADTLIGRSLRDGPGARRHAPEARGGSPVLAGSAESHAPWLLRTSPHDDLVCVTPIVPPRHDRGDTRGTHPSRSAAGRADGPRLTSGASLLQPTTTKSPSHRTRRGADPIGEVAERAVALGRVARVTMMA